MVNASGVTLKIPKNPKYVLKIRAIDFAKFRSFKKKNKFAKDTKQLHKWFRQFIKQSKSNLFIDKNYYIKYKNNWPNLIVEAWMYERSINNFAKRRWVRGSVTNSYIGLT